MLKNIPELAKVDPNRAKVIPNNRENNEFKKYWTQGYSSPIEVRFAAGDAWGLLNHRWPTAQDYQPIPLGAPAKLANYISKYITKSISQKGGTEWKIRQRHQLGLTIITKMVNSLSLYQLNQIIPIAKMQVLIIQDQIIPTQLIVKAAHKRIINSLKNSGSRSTLLKLEARCSIIKHLANMTKTPSTYNLLNTTSIKTPICKTTIISNIQQKINKIVLETVGKLHLNNDIVLKNSSNERI